MNGNIVPRVAINSRANFSPYTVDKPNPGITKRCVSEAYDLPCGSNGHLGVGNCGNAVSSFFQSASEVMSNPVFVFFFIVRQQKYVAHYGMTGCLMEK